MQKTDELVNTLVKAVDDIQNKKAKGYDTQATVTRIEGGTAYVHIPGGVDETPAQMTITAKKGDTVRVRVANGTAWLVGNATAPPTDDATANAAVVVANTATTMAGDAIESANIAAEAAESAKTSAGEAKADAIVANQAASNALRELSTVEDVVDTLEWITAHGTMTLTSDVVIDPSHVYFVVDPTGQYVVGGTHYSIVEEPKQAELNTYYELTIDDAVTNYVATHIVVDTEGLWIVPDTNNANRVLIAHGNGSTYTTAGTYIIGTGGAILAKFLANSAVIGENASGVTRTELSSDGMDVIRKTSSSTEETITHLGYGEGAAQSGTANAPYYTLGTRVEIDNVSEYSSSSTYNYGAVCKYNNNLYVCNTTISTPEAFTSSHWEMLQSGNWSYAEGNVNTASYLCHAEGYNSHAQGAFNHAEGVNNIVAVNAQSGGSAHAEGAGNYIKDSLAAHTEGRRNIINAQSQQSHAEGYGNTISGSSDHAEGYGNTISGSYDHAEGYNNEIVSNSSYSHIEGYGNTIDGSTNHTEGQNNAVDGIKNHVEGENHTLSTGSSLNHVEGSGNTLTYTKRSHVTGSDNALKSGSETYTEDCLVAGVGQEVRGSKAATVLGRYATILDGATYENPYGSKALVVGNGSSTSSRSNAFEVDWNGNVNIPSGNLNINGSAMTDFVIAQGLSSSWYYRKWKSGKVEAWRTYNAGSQTPSQWVTGWYYKDFTVAIPSGIFSSAPNTTIATNNGSDIQFMVFTARATSTTSITVRVVKPNSGAATPVIALYVCNMV